MNQKVSVDCALASPFAVTFDIVRTAAAKTLLGFILRPLAFPKSSNVCVARRVWQDADTKSAKASHTQVSSITGVKSGITGEQGGMV